MPKRLLMFGSIGSIAETSDIQRRAYNQALREAGLAWEWNRDTYAELLEQSGGKERLAMLATATGAKLSPDRIDAVHARKTELACAEIVRDGVAPRPGVVGLVALAKTRGMTLAFVTTTYRANVDAIFAGLGEALAASDFDYIVSRDAVIVGKPAPDAYLVTLRDLGVDAGDAVAIEDTAVSVMSAKRAGVATIATPGAITAGQDFWQADLVVDQLADATGALDPRVVAMLD